ncbi:hypothetical protein OQA88_1844 [Cercophora sp. LCS_1]
MGPEIVATVQVPLQWGHLQLKTGTDGWPAEVRGDLCWDSSTFQSEEDFTLILTDDEVAEVGTALRNLKELGREGHEVSKQNFILPTLGAKLDKLAKDVHSGKGFATIKGLTPERFPEENRPTNEDMISIFLGISSYIGATRGRQDENGNMLMHIRDAKLSRTPQCDRPTRYSSRASAFHTDTFCDILALQTRSCAAKGGSNLLASSWTVYNELKATYPKFCDLLAEPKWAFDSRGSFLKSNTRPLLYFHGGKIMMNFAREPLLGLRGVARADGLAELTESQREALDAVERIATQKQIKLDAESGDMLFINNHAVLHSREAFEDDPANPRYLMRAWLRNPELKWKLPRHLQDGNTRIYDDDSLPQKWNLADAPKLKFELQERLTS